MTNAYPALSLKKEKERSVQRFHPWIFSGAIQSFDPSLKDGDITEVFDYRGNFLCTGHFFHGSISVKILSFEQLVIDQDFWDLKIRKALDLRKRISLISNPQTNCFRLIHAEGDNCPGLIVDIYAQSAVVQCHSIGMHRHILEIAQALKNNLPFLESIYDKSKENLPAEYATGVENKYLLGSGREIIAMENGHLFYIDVERGQKTGFFLDQRDNRQLLSAYVKGKKVLNTYSYSGGFSVYALNACAESVTSVDVSKNAVELVERNISLNFGPGEQVHQAITMDVFDFFKKDGQTYDVIILDPPAFAKSISKRHNAVQAYKRLNLEGLKNLEGGGILFTFSCSQVVDRELFTATVMSAAIEAGREVKILHLLSQPPDHPINIFHPEGSYLKGLVLYVV